MLEQQKQEVLEYAKQSYKEGLFAGTSGNLSVCDRKSGLVAITPSGIDYETMKLEDVMIIDLDGNIVEGNLKPSSEWRLHTCAYKERPEIAAVVHTHSPYATSCAVLGEEIPVILCEMMPFLGGSLRVAKVAVPGTDDLGKEAMKALYNRKACLLESHGTLAVGENMKKAHISAVYIEDSAKVYVLAKMAGPVKGIPENIMQHLKEKYHICED